jgi:uncharacterized protein (DUF433 family)
MKITGILPENSRVYISGHDVHTITSCNEPERHRRLALNDLANAIPTFEAFEQASATVERIVTTPDFHAGRPVPVGVAMAIQGATMPHIIGNDIGCGMRMVVLDGVTEDDLAASSLDGHLRHVHFQGGRNISLYGKQRHASTVALLNTGISMTAIVTMQSSDLSEEEITLSNSVLSTRSSTAHLPWQLA